MRESGLVSPPRSGSRVCQSAVRALSSRAGCCAIVARAEVRQAALGVELLAGQRVVVTARPAKLRRSGDGVRAGEGARVLHVQIVIHELPVGRVHASAVVDGRAGAVVRPRTSLVIAWYLIIPREHPN